MTNQITLEQALELVEFRQNTEGRWYIHIAKGSVDTVEKSVSTVGGNVITVEGNVSFVEGVVHHTINGRKWKYDETQEEKLKRLIKETNNKELIETLNQIENNS